MNSTGTDDEESSTGSILLVLSSAVLMSCLCKIVFVKYLNHKINLSFYTVVLLLGFLIGIIAIQIEPGFTEDHFLRGEHHLSKIGPHLIYYIFLPIIIFDSSFNAHFNIVRQQLITSFLVAGSGVLISTVIITLVVVYLFPSDYQWSWIKGLLFGSILSTTDPGIFISMLQNCGASYSLSSLISSESLLNDGLVFMLYSIFTRIAIGISHTKTQIIHDTIRYGLGKREINIYEKMNILLFHLQVVLYLVYSVVLSVYLY
jgi:NhaP-type Na+/H+ or K+/H+ antiporter